MKENYELSLLYLKLITNKFDGNSVNIKTQLSSMEKFLENDFEIPHLKDLKVNLKDKSVTFEFNEDIDTIKKDIIKHIVENDLSIINLSENRFKRYIQDKILTKLDKKQDVLDSLENNMIQTIDYGIGDYEDEVRVIFIDRKEITFDKEMESLTNLFSHNFNSINYSYHNDTGEAYERSENKKREEITKKFKL